MTYDLRSFSGMIRDRVRTDAYVAALERAIRPGCTVLDLGAGSGFFSFEACRLGAARVWAVDPNPAVLAVRELARVNGLADRIVVKMARAEEIALDAPVDVIVSDLRGALPLFGRGLASVIDARDRLLRPGGALLPWRDELLVTVVDAGDLHARLVSPWGERPTAFSLAPLERMLQNTWTGAVLGPEVVLATAERFGAIDYATVDTPDVAGRARCVVTRSGTAHGLAGHFRTEIAPGIGYLTGPSAPDCVYGSAFFPFPRGVPVVEGDVVEVALRADLMGDHYLWRWTSRVLDGGDVSRVKARFEQSDFFGVPTDPAELARQAPDHRPEATEEARIACFVLEKFGGGDTVGEIARAAAERFPARFGAGRDPVAYVAALATRYKA